MTDNIELVQKALRILLPWMSGYIGREMRYAYKDKWWDEVKYTLSDHLDDLPEDGDYAELVDSLDVANCLRLIARKWNEVFKKKLAIDYKNWAGELMGVRNKVSHAGAGDMSDDDTWRALDTAARLCEAFDEEAAEEIRGILRKFRYGSEEGSSGAVVLNDKKLTSLPEKREGVIERVMNNLPSWRDVISPHPDVAEGRYGNAEFAADLSLVARGEGAIEYRDPVEFFNRTYLTEGMSGLLVQAVSRVAGKGGEPVIQLKTAFGGGKTHSMLALYHMMRANVSAEKLSGIDRVLERAGVSTLKKANIAVLVGTALDPTKQRRPNNMPGITINTIWGEMAAQLAYSAGDMKLYDIVKESDKKGVSPGSETFTKLFDACGPCLVLIDELVAYGRKLYNATGLPAGSFENFLTFIQEVTEAARASKNSLVVASIPESNMEIGGEAGQITLEAIEHTFGRMESVWRPVAANEGYEVVRRRLFLECRDTQARDMICNEFSKFYRENPGDFPLEAREAEYRDRMIACYPIHPEIFERLYNDWSSLERFQRTRGVLRLMAAVIHELWMGRDASAMIMPGSIPLDIPKVRDELVRYLDAGWNPIVTGEVDGRDSVPYRTDRFNKRYSQLLAARRVARTIFLGSAPTSRSQAVKGIEASRIRLGTAQPGESIPIFNDALNALRSSLTYLYANPSGDRYWYDTRPTLRKTAEDRAGQILKDDAVAEIVKRLRGIRKAQPFQGVHVCPASSLDVPDDQSVRLVILRCDDLYKHNVKGSIAPAYIKDIMETRGTSPRINRNMLLFLAPDYDMMRDLMDKTRYYLAWLSIQKESKDLNLDAVQNRETDDAVTKCDGDVTNAVNAAFCWLFVPYIDPNGDIKELQYDKIRLSSGDTDVISAAGRKLLQDEAVITKWAPANLRMELDNMLWKNDNCIQVRKLWEYLCQYCYLPRLTDYSVLEDAIRTGVNSDQYFGYAAGFSADRYIGLDFNKPIGMVDKSAYLVKLSEVSRIQEEERRRRGEEERKRQEAQRQREDYPLPHDTGESSGVTGFIDTSGDAQPAPKFPPQPQPPAERKKHTFYMSAGLDNTRINRDVQRLVEEVLSHLTNLDGCRVEISLEVSAQSDEGFPQPIIRTVSENCTTLKIGSFGFEE